MEEYEAYLLETGQITNPNWLKEYLIPEIKRTFISSTLANKKLLFKNPGVYEMFGVDIVLDENYKLYVIEINPSPMIIGNIPKKTNLF